jgi:NitT/TauT family transport system substrate-binding protein
LTKIFDLTNNKTSVVPAERIQQSILADFAEAIFVRKKSATHFYWLVLICFFASISASLGAEAERTTLGLTTRVGSFTLPYVIAEEKGFLRSEGLNTVVVVMQNQVVVNGVLSRNVDYGGTFQNFIGATLAGLPVRIVMSVMEGADHFLVTSPNIRRVEDLKGKVVGISSFGGTPHSQIIMILRKYGMNPDKDVTFLQIGGTASRYAALESGSIQAAMLVPPFNKLGKKRGFNELLSFNEILKVPTAGVVVHIDKMKEKPEEIVKLIKAMLKSIDFIRNHQNEILSYMEKNWALKDPEVREGIYRDMVGLYTRTGIASDDGMQSVIRMVQETRQSKKNVSLSEIVDWSFAKKANEELKRK